MNNGERIHTVAGLKYDFETLNKMFESGEKYLVKFRTVYQIHYSENAGYYALPLHRVSKEESYVPLIKKGRHFFATAKMVNRLVGRELVNE